MLILEKDSPYELPENWRWIHLLDSFENLTDSKKKIPQKSYLETGTFAVVDQGKELIGGYTNDEKMRFDGNLPVIVFGDHTRCIKYIDFPFAQGADGIKVLKPKDFYYPKAFYYALQSIPFPDLGYRRHFSMFKQFALPLPPLAEQKRIVAKLETLLPLVDQYGDAAARLADYEARFPDDLRKSLLQEAITGRLVPQRAEDGTADALYEAIQQEKARLIAEKKIKKEKPLPPITEEDIPFDIPDTWKWVRIGDLFQHNSGKALNSSDQKGTLLTYITTSNMYWDHFILDNLKSMYFSDADIEKCTVRKNDLLVCEGGDFGRAAIWPYDEETRLQNHIHRLRPYKEVNIKFFYYIFYLYKKAGRIGGKGIGIQNLSSNALHHLIVPLPPLAEQERIVAKLEELLPLAERIRSAR